jgi:hypothetical protein
MKLDSDAMFATTEPLDATIDFGPLERGEKDFVIAMDAMYYDLYECPRVHNLTTVERICDVKHDVERIRIAGMERCSMGLWTAEEGERGIAFGPRDLGKLRDVGHEDSTPRYLESWTRSGVAELPPGATREVFESYGISRRRQDLLQGGWWRDPHTTPSLIAIGAFNSGVYLAKASTASLALFDDWWNMPTAVCAGSSVAPQFEQAMRHLTSGGSTQRACDTDQSGTTGGARTPAAGLNNAFTMRYNDLGPLKCSDGSLRDYLLGVGAGGSPVYEQPALSLALPKHMTRVAAYDSWEFNHPFSKFIWHPYGTSKTFPGIVPFYEKLLLQQQMQKESKRHSLRGSTRPLSAGVKP